MAELVKVIANTGVYVGGKRYEAGDTLSIDPSEAGWLLEDGHVTPADGEHVMTEPPAGAPAPGAPDAGAGSAPTGDVAPTHVTVEGAATATPGQPYQAQATADGSPSPAFELVKEHSAPWLEIDPTSGSLGGIYNPEQYPTGFSFVVRAINAAGSAESEPVDVRAAAG